jgi:AcrR family transcriptional regulator
LWTETIDSHRREVRDAIMGAAIELVGEHGLLAVTMSQVAERAGIGRATLYKYFPDVRAILLAWHELQVKHHIDRLNAVRAMATDPVERLAAVLEEYALIMQQTSRHEIHDDEMAAVLHRDEHVAKARHRLHEMVTTLIVDAAQAGGVRVDVKADELATYCLHALSAAARTPSKDGARRLVAVTVSGLRRPG